MDCTVIKQRVTATVVVIDDGNWCKIGHSCILALVFSKITLEKIGIIPPLG